MTKVEIKQAAQDNLMHSLAGALLFAKESNDTETAIIEEMQRQAVRVGKMFGYDSWPGIGQIA